MRVHEKIDSELFQRVKWLMFFRVLFTTLLLGSTIVVQLNDQSRPLTRPMLILYGLIIGIFLISFLYSFILTRIKNIHFFTYVQIVIDTISTTLIIFLTGSFFSLFSFLYLVVIIYTSMLLYRKGSMIMAVICSIQYGILVDLEYFGLIQPFGVEESLATADIMWNQVLYKILIIMVACFAVAFLSGLLAEEAKTTQKELKAMEAHLKRVEKMAAVGEMAARMAHEIKNPIASLRGAIQLLSDDMPYRPEYDKLMHIILREADRLSSLVSDFLTFSRPPKGKLESVELGKALSDIADIFEKDPTCRGRIDLITEFAPFLWIEIDPTHLRQILLNFLLNAAEAIEGKGTIIVKTYPGKTKQVIIEISDTGCGVEPEAIRSIFDPFYTTKPNGTGLGLSIVHRLIESYEGQVDVESVPHQGTTFKLKFHRFYPAA